MQGQPLSASSSYSAPGTTDRLGKIRAPERSKRPGGSMGLAARLQPTSGPTSMVSSPEFGPSPGISQSGFTGGGRRRRGPRAQKLIPRSSEESSELPGYRRGILEEMDDIASLLAPSVASSSRTNGDGVRVKGPRPAPQLRIAAETIHVKEKLLAAISEELGVVGSEGFDTESSASAYTDRVSIEQERALPEIMASKADISLCSSAIVEGILSPSLPDPLSLQPKPPPSILPNGVRFVATKRPRKLDDFDPLPLIPLPPSPTSLSPPLPFGNLPVTSPIPPPRHRRLAPRRMGYRLRLPGHWVREVKPFDEYMAEPARERWVHALSGGRGKGSMIGVLALLLHVVVVVIAVSGVSPATLVSWGVATAVYVSKWMPLGVEDVATGFSFVTSLLVGLLPESVSEPLMKLGAVGVRVSWETWKATFEMSIKLAGLAYKLIVS
ncbi:hypothetical protein HDU67_008614 [Dinochytrium kinnereticum]|nr:hypothetical protein HDU67_008614 [Dinochytrium kinnereticum]